MQSISRKRRIWSRLRRVWAMLGLTALVGFIGWCLVAYQASGEARQALQSDERVRVMRGEGYWSFVSTADTSPQEAGLLFFPGSLVQPAAYAPLARAVAQSGHPVLLVELPRRGAFGGADGRVVIDRARGTMKRVPEVSHWVIAGHSRGGAVAARFVHEDGVGVAGLVLVGTSHPRDFSLADVRVPVTKILGTRDGLASVEKSERTRGNLPASTRWVLIPGGNHSQFGCYGFQPGDHRATISRHQQQDLTIRAIIGALGSATLHPTPRTKTGAGPSP